MMQVNLRKMLGAGAVCAALITVSTPSYALFGDDEARKAILDLREKVEATQNGQMQLATQIEQLREQNAMLIGRIETLSNELSMQQRSVRDLFANLDKRVATFETRNESVDGKDFTVSAEEKRRYDLALVLFSQGKYEQSQKLLVSLIDEYPETGYMPNALYWLGNALFAGGELRESISVQDRLIKDYPDSARIPEALLSKGAAEASLDRRSQATQTLKMIIKKYPDSESAKLAKDRLQTLTRKSN